MDSTLSWTSNEGVPQLELRAFFRRLAEALPLLMEAVCSPELRSHPVWGQLIPFSAGMYGNERSVGHCIRPDIVLTAQGPFICELDCVPSGRTFIYHALTSDEQRRRYLKAYDQWYRWICRGKVLYATASTTTCWAETTRFCRALRDQFGLDIEAANIDTVGDLDGVLIDRLFYRSEMVQPRDLNGARSITAEPWLDSKMVFALVHDTEMEAWLAGQIGLENLRFLRAAMPTTHPLETVRTQRPVLYAEVNENTQDWVLKSTDVETDSCWGSRGVLLGLRENAGEFRKAMKNGQHHRRDLGAHPVLQRYMPSVDFAQIWNAAAEGVVRAITTVESDQVASVGTTADHIHARVGVHLLVNNRTRKCTFPPYGELTLRPDPLAHGASNALFTAFELV